MTQKPSYQIFQKKSWFFKKEPNYKITLITPVYNAEKSIHKTISSVIHQTIFKEIEYIIIDDCSNDRTPEILKEYATKYSNIKLAFLHENTGSPAEPRNIGIELTTSKYISFLDADDWLDEAGLAHLYQIAEETGDAYVVGKTIQVNNNKTKIVGEHESYIERRQVSPYSIPHIFQHMGPRARMVRTDIIKKHHIRFPHMKYAEDKQFFMDVLIHADTISTTKQVIYYLNRLDENDSSLTKATDIIEKTNNNIAVIHYIQSKTLDMEKKKMILNRLYEFDCVTRLFNRQHFLKSKDMQMYYDLFNKVLETTKQLPYSISEQFFHPINKVAYELFLSGRYDDIVTLFKWDKSTKIKDMVIKDGLPFYISPFKEDAKYQLIFISIAAMFVQDTFINQTYVLNFQLYGSQTDSVNDLVIRSRKDPTVQFHFPIVKDGDHWSCNIALKELDNLVNEGYIIFIRYDSYRHIHITRRTNKITVSNHKQIEFYTTVNQNIGLKISE